MNEKINKYFGNSKKIKIITNHLFIFDPPAKLQGIGYAQSLAGKATLFCNLVQPGKLGSDGIQLKFAERHQIATNQFIWLSLFASTTQC